MTTLPKEVFCYPPAGILQRDERSSITVASKNVIGNAQITREESNCFVKIVALRIEKPTEVQNEYEVLDLFKQADGNPERFHHLILGVHEFVSSENVSYVSCSRDPKPGFASE